jgi:hypothetical protein
VQLALGEVVAQRRVLLGGLGDGVFEAFVFSAGLDRITKLPLQTATLCEDSVELSLVSLQGAGEAGALDRVGVLLAPEATVWLGQADETPGELLALGGEREDTRVEILNALQLACRQRHEQRLQPLDALA